MSEYEAPRIAVIGGGTGTANILRELKYETPNISAVVNMSDDGGSSGILMQENNGMPPGDVRQCLVALSNRPDAEEFNRRIKEGPDAGHPPGNIFLSRRLEPIYRDFQRCADIFGRLLRITGEVVPVTLERHGLALRDAHEIIYGESIIGHRKMTCRQRQVWLEPAATINPRAEEALLNADLIAIAPGNLYGSLLPALLVKGMPETLQRSQADKLVITGLLNKPGQTDGWHAVDYVNEIEKYIGEGTVGSILYNTEEPRTAIISKFGNSGEEPVSVNVDRFRETTARPIGARLLGRCIKPPSSYDPHKPHPRTNIKHDSAAVARELVSLAMRPRD